MNKKFLIAPVIIAIAMIVVLGTSDERSESKAFHVTLANPEQYSEGVFEQNISLEEGQYQFKFVPNGDSPKKLSIILKGDRFEFSNEFVLKGTLHETGISQYYTWDYEGEKIIQIPSNQELKIIINPNGNFLGPVSVSLMKN